MNWFEKIFLGEDVKELLTIAKKENTYLDISRFLGLPEIYIWRYKEGINLPRSEHALELRKKLIKKTLGVRKIISELDLEWENGHLVTWNLAGNTELLKMAAIETHELYGGKKITKVMAAGVESIPFATLVARRFRARLAIAKDADYASGCARRNIYYTQTIEYGPRRRSEGLSVSRQSLKKYDNVLIASLVLTDGLDESCMAKIAGNKAKSNVAGVIGIFGIGDDYKKTLSHVTARKLSSVRVEALYQTNPR